jgi:hypothetical protein
MKSVDEEAGEPTKQDEEEEDHPLLVLNNWARALR